MDSSAPHPYPPSYHNSPAQGYGNQLPSGSYGSYEQNYNSLAPGGKSGGGEYGYSYGYGNAAESTGDLGSIPYNAGSRPGPYGGGGAGRLESDVSMKGGAYDDAPVGGVNSEGQAYPPNWTAEDVRAEQEFMKTGIFDWKRMLDWRFWIRKKWWYWYIIIIICLVLTALMTIYHDEIVKWMKPAATWMKDLPAGYTIPVVILFVISFPPLFGHEIVSVLVGVVWGLWVGFAIVGVGTFLGEIGNYYAFKYCLRSRAEKIERKNFSYACLAHVVREGGFFIIFVARLSAIPGHFTTAVFSTCGVGIWIFSIATILTMPKQLVVVYLGVLFGESGGHKSTKDRIISYVLVGVGLFESSFACGPQWLTTVMTIWAAWYIWRQMHKARVIVWRRKRMAEKGLGQHDISALEEGKPVVVPLTGPSAAKEFPSHGVDPEEDEEARSPMIQKGRQADPYAGPYGQSYGRDQPVNPFESVDSIPPSQAFPDAHPSYGSYPAGQQAPQHGRTTSSSYTTRKPPPPLDFASQRDTVVMPVAKPAYAGRGSKDHGQAF